MMNEEVVPQKSWFKRNWMWVVPTGGCLTLIVLLLLGVGSLFYGVTKIMTNSEPSEYAIEMAQNNAEVVADIGTSIKKNGMSSGNISYVNDDGAVDLQIPIKGSKGEATIFVKGNKIKGQWVYETLYVLINDTQEHVNLLDKTLEGF